MKLKLYLFTLFSIAIIFAAFAYKTRAQDVKIIDWEIKGVAYNPTSIGTDQLDPTAPLHDVPKIAALGANTISTYNLGKAEWGSYSDISVGEVFYDNLYPIAEANNLKIIIGYFSNEKVDWTNATRVLRITSQYQSLVTKARSRPSTLMYSMGNEVFEKLPNDIQKAAYAKWIGKMVDWTHANDPGHPVTYADNAIQTALPWLKTYAPNLDIYSFNNYEWGDLDSLSDILTENAASWPGKSLLLHEWGVDSWNTASWKEDRAAQGVKIKELAQYVTEAYKNQSSPFIGGVYFEYSDQWDKIGSAYTQDPDNGWPWACNTCFDAKANEDYWGLTQSAIQGAASERVAKPAYASLQEIWNAPSPSSTPTGRVKPKKVSPR